MSSSQSQPVRKESSAIGTLVAMAVWSMKRKWGFRTQSSRSLTIVMGIDWCVAKERIWHQWHFASSVLLDWGRVRYDCRCHDHQDK